MVYRVYQERRLTEHRECPDFILLTKSHIHLEPNDLFKQVSQELQFVSRNLWSLILQSKAANKKFSLTEYFGNVMSLIYLLVLGNKGDYKLRKCSGRHSKILIGKTYGFLEIYI
jgi:hypothetical protein